MTPPCTKRQYNSRAQAILEMDRLRLLTKEHGTTVKPGKAGRIHRQHRRKKGARADTWTYVYVCERCGFWHLTSRELGD